MQKNYSILKTLSIPLDLDLSLNRLIKEQLSDDDSSVIYEQLLKPIKPIQKELFATYKKALHKILTSISFQEKPPKSKNRLLKLITINILTILQDEELPPSIKHLCVNRLPIMVKILEKMLSRPSDKLLLNSNGISHFKSYKKIALDLKGSLVRERDQSGISFEGRTEKLFRWCREELSETRNPLVQVLLKTTKTTLENRTTIAEQFETLDDISNLLILKIGACDDISDTIQDSVVTNAVSRIAYAGLEERVELQKLIGTHRYSIFAPYFNKIVEIWDDAILQLENLFGKDYFNKHVKSDFLEIYETVIDSLKYSLHLNLNPDDPDITVDKIHQKLAPNIMVRCFRYLESALVKKIAVEQEVVLPQKSDLDILEDVIVRSQPNAASSNAAATVSRELRENDLSSPFPFDMNNVYMEKLAEVEVTFVKDFEKYIQGQGYENGFFMTYFEDKPDSRYNYLSLLLLRRSIFENVILKMDKLKRLGLDIPDSDYSYDTLAEKTLELTATASGEQELQSNLIKKSKRHINLIDGFSDKLVIETNVYSTFFEKWETEIQEMKKLANTIKDPDLKIETQHYVNSWEEFLCMYLLFKRTFDGTI